MKLINMDKQQLRKVAKERVKKKLQDSLKYKRILRGGSYE